MWSSSIDDGSTVLDPVCDYSVHGSDTTPPWEEVDGGWPHSGTLLHQERWGEWVLFWLQRALYVQYKLIGPPYFLEWNGLSLYSTKQTEGQRLSLCQLRMEPSVVLACLLVISTALETGLLNLSANFCPVICRCTASTHTSTVVSSLDFTINSRDYLLNEADSFSTSYHCLRQLVYKLWCNESAQHNIGTLCSLLL